MKKFTLLVVAILIASLCFGQKIKLSSGNLSVLKGEAVVKVEYTYDNLKVGKMAEKDYIEKRISESERAKPGDGKRWVESWNNDRGSRYQVKFEELYNKIAKKNGFQIDPEKEDARYKMIVNTYFIEPGFNVGVMRKNSLVSMTITFVETANPNNVIAVFDVSKSPGSDVMGVDFDTGWRISEAYAKAGKAFSNHIIKKHLK